MNVTVELREVDASNRAAIEALRVSPEQRAYLDTPDLRPFLQTAPEHPTFTCCGIYADGEAVGFVSFGHEPDSPRDGWIPLLLIDERYQGRGYGRAALGLVLERLGREVVGLERVGLSYKPENAVAAALYRSAGFVADSMPDESGEVRAWLRVAR